MSLDWAETKNILAELEQLFNRDDDVRDIDDIKKMSREIGLHYTHTIKDFKELIKEYTKQVAAKEQDIRTATITATNSTSLSRDISIHDKENAFYDIELLKRAVDQKKASIAALSAEIETLEKQRTEIDADANIRESRTSYALSLYSKISNIAWDYTAPAGHLAGCISCDAEKAFKSFDVQIEGMTSFDVANEMWDMIYDAVEA